MSGKYGFARVVENYPGSDITPEEWEFLKAVEAYQRRFRRRYPSWREVLAVLKSLGYRRVAAPTPLPANGRQPPVIALVDAARNEAARQRESQQGAYAPRPPGQESEGNP